MKREAVDFVRRLILAQSLFALAGCASRRPMDDRPLLDDPRLQGRLETYLEALRSDGFSGVTLISRSARPLLVRTYGGVRRTSRFWIGSLTKPITATAILRLQEQGRLRLDDSIGRFFPDAPADKRSITIRQLLTHSSGLPHRYAAEGVGDWAEAARAILALPLSFPPGSDVAYSNDGFSLLALIIVKASGRAYETLLRDFVLRPAAMTSSGFWPPSARPDGAFAPVAAAPEAAVARPNWGYRGATGVYSTVDDLLRFVQALRGGRILSPASARQAMDLQIPRPGRSAVGYGWFVEDFGGGRLVTHAGAESGLRHFGWIHVLEPSETVLVVLSNSEEENAADVVDRILGILAADQQGRLRSRASPQSAPGVAGG